MHKIFLFSLFSALLSSCSSVKTEPASMERKAASKEIRTIDLAGIYVGYSSNDQCEVSICSEIMNGTCIADSSNPTLNVSVGSFQMQVPSDQVANRFGVIRKITGLSTHMKLITDEDGRLIKANMSSGDPILGLPMSDSCKSLKLIENAKFIKK